MTNVEATFTQYQNPDYIRISFNKPFSRKSFRKGKFRYSIDGDVTKKIEKLYKKIEFASLSAEVTIETGSVSIHKSGGNWRYILPSIIKILKNHWKEDFDLVYSGVRKTNEQLSNMYGIEFKG